MIISKKKDNKEISVNDVTFPETLEAMQIRFTNEEVYALAKSALVIRLQSIISANMDKSEEEILCLFRDFKPGQGRGSNGVKETLIEKLVEAGINIPNMSAMTTKQLEALTALIPA